MNERDDMADGVPSGPDGVPSGPGQSDVPGGYGTPGGSAVRSEDSVQEEERPPDERRPQDESAFTDERVLAFALGPDDDPELRAAAAGDAGLRARIETTRADVDAIGAGLDRIVPAPPDGYTDLADERWKRLREHMTTPATARRRPLWVRVLVPAAAVAAVLVAGVVGLQHLSGGATTHVRSAAEQPVESFSDQTRSAQDGVPGGAATGGEGASREPLLLGAPDPSGYAAVVVARAASPADLSQRFTVVRVLRDAGGDLAVGDGLKLVVVDRAIAADRLVVLYLDPRSTPSPSRSAPLSPVPAPMAAGTEAAVVAYEYRGQSAFALRLPPGTDPDAVKLP
ncbi:MAG TPA: hypothetical protein PLB30_08575 [Thermoleophilia bacterium]|nr:hypothetical protein [Thermoleophilia bacterium]